MNVLKSSTMDPELSKALAREIYVDSNINVVSPSRNSPGKVKPGQMNLFNPAAMNF